MVLFDAVYDAESKIECRKIDSGACWAVITKRVGQFVYGFYPEAEDGELIFHFLPCS